MATPRNRVLFVMAAAAALAAPQLQVGNVIGQLAVSAQQARSGSASPPTSVRGPSSSLGLLRYGGGVVGVRKPRYKKDRGPGHLAAKRIKRKVRNRLRAKRQFRRAVR